MGLHSKYQKNGDVRFCNEIQTRCAPTTTQRNDTHASNLSIKKKKQLPDTAPTVINLSII